MRLRTAFTLLVLLLVSWNASAQEDYLAQFGIDNFDAVLQQTGTSSPDLTFPVTDPFTFLNPDVVGGETDVILNLIDAPDATSGIQVAGANGAFTIQTDPGTTSRVFIVYDGLDGDAIHVVASEGLNGFDLTLDSSVENFLLDANNLGNALNISIDVFSGLENRSSTFFEIPSAWSGPLTIPFSDFQPVENPADFESVNAIIMIVGAGGGVQGPVALEINGFLLGIPQPVIPPASAGVVVNQLESPRGDEWYITDFGGTNPFNAQIQDDFHVTATTGLTIRTVEFDGFYRPSAPSNPTAEIVIREDDNGAPGSVISNLSGLPVQQGSENTLIVDLGTNSPLLQTGTYWFGLQGNVPIGTEVLTHSTPITYTTPAHWENPGGAFGRSCPTASPINTCGSNDYSWRFKLTSDPGASPPDLALTKSVAPESVSLGESLTFTIVVKNVSQQDATGAYVTDHLMGTLPSSVTSSQGSCSFSGFGKLECSTGPIAAGDSVTITVDAIASSSTSTTNNAFVIPDDGDTDSSNNGAGVSWNVTPKLDVSKTSAFDEYLPGNKIDFNLTISNTTTTALTGLAVQDIYFNDQFKYIESSGSCINTSFPITSTLTCPLPTIQASEAVTATINMQAIGGARRLTNSTLVSDGPVVLDFGNRIVKTLDSEVVVDLNILNAGIPDFTIDGGSASSKSTEAVAQLVDLYLGDTKVGEDVALGQTTGWFPFTLDARRDTLYIVPADSSDISSAVDSLELLIDPGLPPGGGSSSFVILVDDATGGASPVVMDGARREAADPAVVEVVVVNAAPNLGPILSFVDLPSAPLILAEDLVFGAFGPYVIIDPPGTYNYTVTPPDDGTTVPEVFRMPTDTPGQVYTIVVAPDSVARYTVIALDGDGARIQSPIVTGTESTSELPSQWALHQNFPNPFSGITEISYDVPAATDVQLSLFDIAGRRVAVLDAGQKSAGRHRVLLDAKGIAPGVYFFRLSAGNWSASKRMVLVR